MARVPLKWDGGVNQLIDPQSIGDNQVVESKNAYPSQPGLLDKREVVRSVGELYHQLAALIIRPITLFVPDPVMGLDFVLHGTFAPSGSGEFITIVRGSTQVLATTPPSVETIYFNLLPNNIAGPASIVNFRGRVLAVAGFMDGFAQLTRSPAGAYSWNQVSFVWPAAGGVTAQNQAVAVQPRLMAVFRGRCVWLNFGKGKGNWLVFGDRDVPAAWSNFVETPPWALVGNDVLTDNGRHLELAAIQGEDITCAREVSLQATGSPIQTALLIHTNRHSMLCTGEPSQTTDTGFATPSGYINDFVANKVNYECGCVGPQAICDTPYGTCWASDDDVWMLQGNAPMRIGSVIRPVLQNTPPAFRKFWSMAYANGTVFLAICTQASSSDLDLRIQHWRLDLRQGLEKAVWYGPMDYETLPDYAAALDTAYTLSMTPSLVSKRGAGANEVVYGAIAVGGYAINATAFRAYPRINFITYNESFGSEDIPFKEVRTARVWSSDDFIDGTVIPVGDLVRPTILAANGRMYVCTVSGIPGAVEPTWPTAAGSNVVDGGVTWTEIQTDVAWNRLPYYTIGGPTFYSVGMDVLFKDFNFGVPNREKVLRRADVVAAFGTKGLAALRVTIEQGAKSRVLGPVPIGGTDNDLLLATMDESPANNEYQARTMRPSSDYSNDHAIDSYTEADASGVIRGKSLQLRFTDDSGFVIDDTNNVITWGTYLTAKPVTLQHVWTANIPNGRYADLGALQDAIVAAMNVVQNPGNQSEFTWNADPWGYAKPYDPDPQWPYFANFSFAFTARRSSGLNAYAMSFFFGEADESVDDGATTLLANTTVYPKRTKRLLGMLGFDTTETRRDAEGLSTTYGNGEGIQMVAESEVPFQASPLYINGVQIIGPLRRPLVSLSDIELDYYVKPGLPFSKRNR